MTVMRNSGDLAARVLADARRLVARGWVQGELEVIDSDPAAPNRYCVIGATAAAADGLGPECFSPLASADDRLALRSVLADEARARFAAVVGTDRLADYNDAEGRTQAEVLAAFDRALA